MGQFESKNTILTKKLNNVVYELLVKSSADMVYTDENTTLTDTLSNITDVLTNHNNSITDVMGQLTNICGDVTAIENEITEIWRFLNDHETDEGIAQLLNGKVDKEAGKGLSQCDFTQFFKDKLQNDYSREELNAKFEEMLSQITELAPSNLVDRVNALESKPSLVISDSEDSEVVENLPDGSIWLMEVNTDE